MGRPLIVPFPVRKLTDRTQVGGKGASLIWMVEAGLPVPPSSVLTTTFFAPWFEEVKTFTTWRELTEAMPDDWAPLCSQLKDRVQTLPLTATQQEALFTLHRSLAVPGDTVRFAVHSS